MNTMQITFFATFANVFSASFYVFKLKKIYFYVCSIVKCPVQIHPRSRPTTVDVHLQTAVATDLQHAADHGT